jgi:hypothetical protein
MHHSAKLPESIWADHTPRKANFLIRNFLQAFGTVCRMKSNLQAYTQRAKALLWVSQMISGEDAFRYPGADASLPLQLLDSERLQAPASR